MRGIILLNSIGLILIGFQLLIFHKRIKELETFQKQGVIKGNIKMDCRILSFEENEYYEEMYDEILERVC